MEMREIILVADAIEKITELTDTTIPEVVDALTGLCFDEESAGDIKRYHYNESEL